MNNPTSVAKRFLKNFIIYIKLLFDLCKNTHIHDYLKSVLYNWKQIKMDGIYLLLGTNLGDREANLRTSKSMIVENIGEIVVFSSIYETAAWGIKSQPGFLNQVIGVHTEAPPEILLDKVLWIESDMGRIRKDKWGPRLIDIDILYYNDLIIDSPRLTIPHPQIQYRNFTLTPLAEIIPASMHPLLKKSQQELLKSSVDGTEVALWK